MLGGRKAAWLLERLNLYRVKDGEATTEAYYDNDPGNGQSGH